MTHEPPNFHIPDPGDRHPRQYVIGTITGILASLIYWSLYFHQGTFNLPAILALPIAKLVVGTIFHLTPKYKFFGNGIVSSMLVGFLIFFGTCWLSLS
jgi:hypothetical protein